MPPTEDTAPLPEGKTLRFTKFGAPWCGPCMSMERMKTLEKLAAAYPDVEVENIMLDYDDDGDEIENEKSAAAAAADVQALPTFIITDAEGEELVRDSGAMSLAGLERLIARAKKRAAKR